MNRKFREIDFREKILLSSKLLINSVFFPWNQFHEISKKIREIQYTYIFWDLPLDVDEFWILILVTMRSDSGIFTGPISKLVILSVSEAKSVQSEVKLLAVVVEEEEVLASKL